jgi:hypothetical protein
MRPIPADAFREIVCRISNDIVSAGYNVEIILDQRNYDLNHLFLDGIVIELYVAFTH